MKQQFLAIIQSPTGDRPIIAVILLLFGVFMLALQDVTVKFIAHETSFWQFQTLRSVGNGLFLASLAWFSGGFGILVPKSWRPVYFRASMITICMFFFFRFTTTICSANDCGFIPIHYLYHCWPVPSSVKE